VSFLKIHFPERETYSWPKERKNALSEIESALSRNALSRGESWRRGGGAATYLTWHWVWPFGHRQVGPREEGAAWPGLFFLPHRRAPGRGETPAPTALAGASGHDSGRATYR